MHRSSTRLLHSVPISAPFVHRHPQLNEIDLLCGFISSSKNLVCITGAGVSTSSGLPDYRGENGSYKLGHKPMVHSDFVGNLSSRQRYWTRSMVGFERVYDSYPNDSHMALAKLEKNEKVEVIVTQNVDRLHQKGGSQNVVDLHGRIDENICMQCNAVSSRAHFQQRLYQSNPDFASRIADKAANSKLVRADGDMDLGGYDHTTFTVPCCEACGGVVKPHVVFFGDNVPKHKVEQAYADVDKCDALLVVGTSLEVFSAYRFVLRAEKLGVPIAIINHGETWAERQTLMNIRYKSDANCGLLLKEVADRLCE